MPRRTLEHLLAHRIGLDSTTVGEGQLARALHARMSALGVARVEDYARLVRQSHEEQEALIEDVVVPESWFFRDERPFERLADVVREGWLARPERPPLRMLSLPCAGGEEPYSVALVLLDVGLPPERWSIVAADVSARALERAALGCYRENAFRGGHEALRARYFRAVSGGYELDPAVRALVRFVRGNLLDPHLLEGESPFDVIFCRNLLIYLDPASRRRGLATLDRLLAPEGLLVLGHAEQPDDAPSRFEPCGGKGGFAYRRASPRLTTIAPPAWSPPTPRAKAPKRVTVPPARPPVPPPRPLLEQAAALAGEGQNEQAAALCERSLREAGPSAQAFFLLGMIRQASGDARGAEGYLQKTVYLDPTHDDALLSLALIAERRGDAASAASYRRRAERAHRRKEVR